MKYDAAYELAVNYVFGDTIVVSNDKTGVALSNEGYRAVTVNGDVYEPVHLKAAITGHPSISAQLSQAKTP
jgi:chromosome segregation ATPase